MTTNEILKNKAAEQSTDTLLGSLFILDAKGDLTAEERMVKASISDAITERHGLDALLDEVFMDLDFAGTYTDALLIALAKVAA